MTGWFHGPLTGRKVLAICVAFFGLVFLANGIMAWFALETFSGLEEEDAYRKGRQYGQLSDAVARQDALGWQVVLAEGAAAPDGDGFRVPVMLTVTDAAGAPVSGLSVRAQIRRPATNSLDRQVDLIAGAPGQYVAAPVLPLAGKWLVRVQAERPGTEDLYNLRQELWISPP